MDASKQLPLNEELHAASKKTHRSNTNLLNARLVVLFTDRVLYGKAIGCFWPVFKALEEALVNSTHPDVKKVLPSLTSGLMRTEGIEKDLLFYLGPSWKQRLPPSKSTQAYVAHIQQLAKTSPDMLLVHAYTQHMAMASGGQFVKRWARRQMQLPADQGIGIFDMPNPPGLKAGFLAVFNELGKTMTPEQRKQALEEHLTAFKFNSSIMWEFRVGWWKFVRGLVLLLPLVTRLSLLCVLVCLLAIVWSQWAGQHQVSVAS